MIVKKVKLKLFIESLGKIILKMLLFCYLIMRMCLICIDNYLLLEEIMK